MLHFRHSKNLPKTHQLFYIVTATPCDCGSIFCHCYDVSGLYFVVVMTFMCNGSDCGFNFIDFIKDL